MNPNFNHPDFAYWLGIMHSDGYVKHFKKRSYYIGLGVGTKSLPMFNKFIEISQDIFGIKGSIYKGRTKEDHKFHQYRFGCTSFISMFTENKIHLKGHIIPEYFVKNKALSGPYLAGLIDGDGDLRISSRSYPQCFIRIYASYRPDKLIAQLEEILKCSINYLEYSGKRKIGNREFFGTTRRIEFRVIPNNFNIFKNYILPYIQLGYKREKLKEYIEMRGRPPRIEVT
ncbi:hypothetical protein JXC34_05040 [Candidatus Woesearchaeota archaeon]|nr:hypothetical protein [Candidatus Woesearchaeota archaeon]